VATIPMTKPEAPTLPRKNGLRGQSPSTTSHVHAGEPAFVKLGCSQCRAVFILDMEEQWNRVPAEMETIGRRFLGVSQDAALCSRCLHEVETAGAERIYWSHAAW